MRGLPVTATCSVTLLLSFSTVTAPVAEELVVLFDAMAGTLQLEPVDQGRSAHATQQVR
jgi:hypothetical protein